ncbi:replication factor C subunit 4 isoform X2 [Parasteatoda tepidariorum]|nr:replication factor C subunit 4 isoform X2 [Parasteatoda tepidariorum]XP_015907259.1 replication factor C subunit 4 isoform X2 [Parasteatoda tepidariorum]
MEAFLKGYKPGSIKVKPSTSKDDESASTSKKTKRPTPWVEKYRPKCMNEVVYQDEVVAVLKKSLANPDLPNLLFYGPPGTGKTSTILALSREIFGDMFKTRILELNASDERGIQVIRDKVKTFAQQTASATRPDGRPCPPFKIVILDEADSMTNAAQSALRRTMEKASKSTRFCLICNYISRIIDPLTSRCSKFRFKPLSKETLSQRLNYITTEENVKLEEKVIDSIIEYSEGDLRKAITLLQSAHRLKGEDGITATDVADISGIVPNKWLKDLMKVCQSDSYEKLENFVCTLSHEGYTAGQLINQLHDEIVFNDTLNDKQKSAICEKLAICDKRLLDGADEFLQLMDLCCTIMQQICHTVD